MFSICVVGLALTAKVRMSTLPIVLGKALVYGMMYSVTTFYILGLHY